MMRRFKNRQEGATKLAQALSAYRDKLNVLVLGLARGGVPIALTVAQSLHLPVDILLVRKLGVPGHEELAMGAISSNGVCVLNEDVIYLHQVSKAAFNAVLAREQRELQRRNEIYRHGRPFPELTGKEILICDDGIATGATMRAAIENLKASGANRVIACAPVASPDVEADLGYTADAVITVIRPSPLYGIGMWYDDFPQLEDKEVLSLLAQTND